MTTLKCTLSRHDRAGYTRDWSNFKFPRLTSNVWLSPWCKWRRRVAKAHWNSLKPFASAFPLYRPFFFFFNLNPNLITKHVTLRHNFYRTFLFYILSKTNTFSLWIIKVILLFERLFKRLIIVRGFRAFARVQVAPPFSKKCKIRVQTVFTADEA